MATNKFMIVDGSILEGGGQILRNTGALCCLLNKPVTVTKIRAGRSKPGLRAQHLSGLKLLKDISQGKLVNGELESTQISLTPKSIKGGSYFVDVKTAGSVCLLAQAALPCLFFADAASELRLQGGTNADMAPQIDYFIQVTKPMFAKFGLHFDVEIKKRGFFPKGGGQVIFRVDPVKLIKPVEMVDPGNVTNIRGLSYVAGVLPLNIAETSSECAKRKIHKSYPSVTIDIACVKESHDKAVGNGSGIIITAETSNKYLLAGTGLGRKGVRAEDVGENAAKMLLTNLSHAGCVDEFTQDQVIILMALADGKSRVKCGPLTLHTQTAIHVAEQLTDAKFNIEQVNEDENVIECQGIGLKNPYL